MYDILRSGRAESNEFSRLMSDGTLQMCNTVPDKPDPIAAGQCRVIWDGVPRDNWIEGETSSPASASSSSPTDSSVPVTSATASADASLTSGFQNQIVATSTSTVFVAPTATTIEVTSPILRITDRSDENLKVVGFSVGNQTAVNITGMGYDDTRAELDESCLWALNYPVSILHNTKREDLTFICFQVWVLGMSVVALLNESIPHILASLLTHILATAWAIYQIFHTMDFQRTFKKVISQGACNGTNLLSTYWKDRAMAEIPGLALNGLGLLLSGFLTYKLFKLFGWQTFKRVGASLLINRLYKVVLFLSITIQIAAFFVAVTAALWLDQLFNTNLGRQATFKLFYKISTISILVGTIPWLILGWISVRKEKKICMYFFLAISIVYLAGFGAMFYSWTFRWEFLTWSFFSVMSSLSVVLSFGALVLGMISFFNFGKGLPRYLEAQEELPGDDFPPVKPGNEDPEKVAFPENGPIPTFSAAFGKGDEVPVPSKMYPGRQVGPRFFRSETPFESSSEDRTTITSGGDLQRVKSNASESSLGSYYSYSGRSDVTQTKNTRWVIE